MSKRLKKGHLLRQERVRMVLQALGQTSTGARNAIEREEPMASHNTLLFSRMTPEQRRMMREFLVNIGPIKD